MAAYVRELLGGSAVPGAGAATQVVTLTAGATSGSFIVMVFTYKSVAATSATVTDTRGNTWAVDVGPHNANNNSILMASTRMDVAPLRSGDTVTVTLSGGTFAGGVTGSSYWIEEFAGITSGAALDQATLNDNASALTGTTGTTAATAREGIVVAGITIGSVEASLTASAYTLFPTGAQLGSSRSNLAGYKIVTLPGTQSETFNWSAVSDFSTGVIAAYKAASTPQPVFSPIPFIAPGRI